MSSYQVLARRFRPQRFSDLVGQDVVVRTLRNALASQQIAHAYLFCGLRGVGKTTVARLLAKALNCEQGPTPDPCGVCTPCTEIAQGSSLDVLEIDAASNRGIDDVRELREVARVLPMRDRYRVFIIDEAHQLTDAAFNALLKILEEPPAHVVFVLASTEKHKFPATILSRCLQLDFRPIPSERIVARLLEVAVSDGFTLAEPAALLISRAAEGSLRDALSLLDRVRAFAEKEVDENAVATVLGLPPFETLIALWRALVAGDVATALELARQDEQSGHDPIALYEQFIELIHSVLLLACDAKAPSAIPANYRDVLQKDTDSLGLPIVLRLAALALEQKSLLIQAERPGLAVAVALGRLALWPRLQRVEALLQGEVPSSSPPPLGRSGTSIRSNPPASPSTASARATLAPQSAPAGNPLSRLVAALEASDAPLLAGRVRSAQQANVNGDTLVLSYANVPATTLKLLRDATEQLAAAAQKAGLPHTIRIDSIGGEDSPTVSNGLRARVEAEESVRTVLDIFGGRLEKVEVKS